MELDKIPLWRGGHVPIRQLVEDFARYLYLPRLRDPAVLLQSVRDGLVLLTWEQDSFAYADSFDEAAGRYRGLRGGHQGAIADWDSPGLLVRPEVARTQLEAEVGGGAVSPGTAPGGSEEPGGHGSGPRPVTPGPGREERTKPKRFHGSASLDPARVGRDASKIADEVVAHLVGLVGAKVEVTLEVEAEIPTGVPDHVVRTVTENARTLKFKSQGFEEA